VGLDVSLVPTLKGYGMVVKTGTSEQNNIWSCPTRNFLPRLQPGMTDLLAIGYQYFGGLKTWKNLAGTIANAPSPVKLGNAKPGWAGRRATAARATGVLIIMSASQLSPMISKASGRSSSRASKCSS
jgi:hypothetical protein